MLQVSRADVVDSPFPHVMKDGILPAELFARLRADFPTARDFEDQYSDTGAAGSRTGKGTGFDIYRGDDEYDRLVARSPAWKEFDGYINSPAFVETFKEVFGPDLDALGCTITVESGAYDRGNVEGRDVLTPSPTMGQRLRGLLPKKRTDARPVAPLFTRLDIEKSTVGYAKVPHCDRANRLCSLIVYFTDLEAEGVEGGELNIYRHKQKTVPAEHERHPQPQDVEVVASVKPRPNLGVFFPCSSNSYHGVNAITTPGKERDFLYINISADQRDCW